MTLIDLSGYLACSLVLATFIMRDMAALRATAMLSNIAFISYAYWSGLEPVLLLHLTLLPINLKELVRLLRMAQSNAADATA